MGEHKGLYRLVGKAMLHDDFRGWLLKEPEEAAASMDVTLTEEQVENIQQVDPETLEELVQEFKSLPAVRGIGPQW